MQKLLTGLSGLGVGAMMLFTAGQAQATDIQPLQPSAGVTSLVQKVHDWDGDWHNRWRSHHRWGSGGWGGDWHNRWRSHYRWGSGGYGGDWHNRWRSHYRWGSRW